LQRATIENFIKQQQTEASEKSIEGCGKGQEEAQDAQSSARDDF
jgi:hypothetical protein